MLARYYLRDSGGIAMLGERGNARHSPGGFTLIEILISMALFAIGMLAVAGMFMLQTRGNTFGGGLTVANDLALQQIEQIMNVVPPATLGTLPAAGVFAYLNADGVGCAAGTTPPCYSRAVSYPGGVGSGPNGTTPVLVAVSWVDQTGGTHSVTMATLKR